MKEPVSVRVLVIAALGTAPFLGAADSFAQANAAPTTVTVDAPAIAQVSDTITVTAKVSHRGDPCPVPAYVPATPGTLAVNGISYALSGSYPTDRRYVSCSDGVYTDGADVSTFTTSKPGDFTFNVEYSGAAGLAPSSSGAITVKVVDGFTGTVGQGEVKVKASGINSEFYCPMHAASVVDGAPPGAPAELAFPAGYVSYAFTACKTECSGFCPPPPGEPTWSGQLVTLELPQPPAAGSRVWIHAPGGGIPTPVWRRIEPQVDGRTVTFLLTGNGGESELRGVFAIANGDGERSDLQDLWWGGTQENGWGIGISQIGDRLFAGLFTYAADGLPLWLVMPGGSWDAAHTTFSGDVYQPQGSPFTDYHAENFSAGLPLLKGKLTFGGTSSALLELTNLAGTTIRKSIVRQPFGTSQEQGPFSGQWWGGVRQNGWGISIAQQGETLFAAWYTYALGRNQWFVMPGGTWTARSTFGGIYTGTLYRTHGSPWFPGPYDPSKLVVTPAGSFSLEFFAPDLAQMRWTVDGVEGGSVLYKQPF